MNWSEYLIEQGISPNKSPMFKSTIEIERGLSLPGKFLQVVRDPLIEQMRNIARQKLGGDAFIGIRAGRMETEPQPGQQFNASKLIIDTYKGTMTCFNNLVNGTIIFACEDSDDGGLKFGYKNNVMAEWSCWYATALVIGASLEAFYGEDNNSPDIVGKPIPRPDSKRHEIMFPGSNSVCLARMDRNTKMKWKL